jgi:hypothetical protein
MKKVIAQIQNGKLSFDFDGFPGRSCQKEEDLIRLILGKVGVSTDVAHSDNKKGGETNGIAEREKLGQ